MGLPPKIVVPIVTVFAVVFLGIMAYFLRIGFATTGAAFGPQAAPHEQGDARIAATPVPNPALTDPGVVVEIPQSGGGPAAGNAAAGNAPPAPVVQLLTRLKARVANNPRDIAALVELGNLYFDATKFDGSVDYYRRALALDPSNPQVRTAEAAALHAAGRDLDALAEVDRVLRERPQFPQALFDRGIILGSMGRRSDAVVAYQKFLHLAPHDTHAAEAQAALEELQK